MQSIHILFSMHSSLQVQLTENERHAQDQAYARQDIQAHVDFRPKCQRKAAPFSLTLEEHVEIWLTAIFTPTPKAAA